MVKYRLAVAQNEDCIVFEIKESALGPGRSVPVLASEAFHNQARLNHPIADMQKAPVGPCCHFEF